MSNRPNQSDFDDDDFRFDDNDDFDFGEDDDAFGRGLGDDMGGDDLPPLDEDGDDGGGRGPSRTFIVIAALMILLFVIGLGALGFFFLRTQGISPAAQTATAESGTIIAMNLTTVADTTLTAEAALLFSGTQTQEAIALTMTASDPTPRARPNGASATAHDSDDVSFAPVGTLNQGEAATVIGVSDRGTGWYLVELPNGTTGWVNGADVTVSGDVSSLQSVTPPTATETPTPTLDATDLAALSFSMTQTQAAVDLTLTASDVTPRAMPNGASANVHSGDSTNFSVLDSLNQGESAIVLGSSDTGSGWYQVQLPSGTIGWVNGADVTITGDISSLPSISPPPSQGIAIDAVQQTATRLAEILQAPPTADGSGGGVIGSPTPEGGFGPLPTALPDTGIFDDIAAGGTNGISMIALAIVGLLGVIFVSRRMRSSINK